MGYIDFFLVDVPPFIEGYVGTKGFSVGVLKLLYTLDRGNVQSVTDFCCPLSPLCCVDFVSCINSMYV